MGLLEGDTGLITGAASGIGRGIVKALAAEGVRLVLSDIAQEPGQALARELNATFVTALTSPIRSRHANHSIAAEEAGLGQSQSSCIARSPGQTT